MSVTQEKIEDAVVAIWLKSGTPPTKLFLDTKSYREFCRSLTPIQRIPFEDTKSNVLKMYHFDGAVEIFEVNTEKELFQLV